MDKLLPGKGTKKAEYEAILKEITDSRETESGITIDGTGSMDLDDGFTFKNLGDRILLKVFISDTTSVIEPYSFLYNRAMKRLESIYRANYTRPMLPGFISEDLLSLLPGKQKPVICFEIELLYNGTVVNTSITEKTFENRRQLSYPEFDDILKNKKSDPDYKAFKEMADFALLLLESRKNNGAIALFDISRGIYTNEEGILISLADDKLNLGYIVVQEFMILVNSVAAMFMAEKGVSALFRNHTASLNAPDRNEIIGQVQAAKEFPSLVGPLQKRMALWFGRAEYSPYLKGHYGLNLPAFVHITSPIRRAADMINHFILKSHIEGKNPTFGFNDLNNMACYINEKIARRKDERAQHLKEAAELKAEEKLDSYREEAIMGLSISEFEFLIKTAAKQPHIPRTLAGPMIKKMEDGTASILSIFYALFRNNFNSKDWIDFKKSVLVAMGKSLDTCVQVVNILKQKDMVSGFETEIKMLEGCFLARTRGQVDGRVVDIREYSFGLKKKEAIWQSIFHFMFVVLNIPVTREIADNLAKAELSVNAARSENLPADLAYGSSANSLNHSDRPAVKSLNVPIVNINDMKPIETTGGSGIPEINYIGRLHEMYYANKGWNEPEFEFFATGMPEKPGFVCRCKLVTPAKTYIETGNSSNKKSAKQAAAQRILEKLTLEAGNQPEKEVKCIDNSKNHISMLLELCTQKDIPLPIFEFRQSGMQHKPVFYCTVSITIQGKTYVFEAEGDSKKSSKLNASQKGFRELSGILSR